MDGWWCTRTGLESERATSFHGASRVLLVNEDDWLLAERCASCLVLRGSPLRIDIQSNSLHWKAQSSRLSIQLHHSSISPSNHRPAMPQFFTQHRQPLPTETPAQPDHLSTLRPRSLSRERIFPSFQTAMIQIAPACCTPPEYDRCDGCDRVESGEKSL